MNIFDVLMLLLIVIGLIKGAGRGFIKELSGFIGIIVGIYFARYYSNPMTELFKTVFNTGEYSNILGFVATFALALLLLKFAASFIEKLVALAMLGWLNKLLGAVFSCFRYMFFVSIFVNIFDHLNTKAHFFSEAALNSSHFYYPLRELVPSVLPFLHLQEIFKIVAL